MERQAYTDRHASMGPTGICEPTGRKACVDGGHASADRRGPISADRPGGALRAGPGRVRSLGASGQGMWRGCVCSRRSAPLRISLWAA